MTDDLYSRPVLREPSAACPECGALVVVSRVGIHKRRDEALTRLLATLDDEALEHLSQLATGELVELDVDEGGLPLVAWPADVEGVELDVDAADPGVELVEEFVERRHVDTGGIELDEAAPEPWAGSRGYPRRG